MKKPLRLLLAILPAILIAALFLFRRAEQMENTIDETYASISDIDLTALSDGIYEGSFGEFLVSVDLRVTVSENQITNIEIINQKSGKGYEAHETLQRIIQAQSPAVDAVSGATVSSKSIMIAVYKALTE